MSPRKWGLWVMDILYSRKGRIPWLYTLGGTESQEICKAGKRGPFRTIMAGLAWRQQRGPGGGEGAETNSILKVRVQNLVK